LIELTKKYYIYALIDPRNDKIFYIGKGTKITGRWVERYLSHVYLTIRGNTAQNTKKYRKIRRILDAGFTDLKYSFLYQSDTEYGLDEMEIKFIREYRERFDLCNISDGGTGGKIYKVHPMQGKKLPDWWRQKLSESHMGLPSARKGKKVTNAETINKIKIARSKQNGEKHPRFIVVDIDLKEKIIQMRKENKYGFTGRRTIARKLNTSHAIVKKVLKEQGITC
jgi:hypothetical protein